MENRRNASVAVGAATEKPKSNTQAQDKRCEKYTPNLSDEQKKTTTETVAQSRQQNCITNNKYTTDCRKNMTAPTGGQTCQEILNISSDKSSYRMSTSTEITILRITAADPLGNNCTWIACGPKSSNYYDY